MSDVASPSVSQRLDDLRSAERDLERGRMEVWGEQRLQIVAKLTRIRRQIKMLTEADR